MCWLGSWAASWQDVRYGLRTLRKTPTFAAVAVVTLALGIGVNAGIFSVVNAVLFRTLSARRRAPARLGLAVGRGRPRAQRRGTHFPRPSTLAYRDRAQTLSGMAAFGNAMGGGDARGRVAAQEILGLLVSCNYFTVLQQPPMLGRGFAARDCEPGAQLVVVLSVELWRAAFAADQGIVGRTIQLNRQQVIVAGVSAEGTFSGSPFLGGGYLAPITAGRRLSSGDLRYNDARAHWLNLHGPPEGRRRPGARAGGVRRRRGADRSAATGPLDAVDDRTPGQAHPAAGGFVLRHRAQRPS